MKSALICSQSSLGGCRGPRQGSSHTYFPHLSKWMDTGTLTASENASSPCREGGVKGLLKPDISIGMGLYPSCCLLAKTGEKSAASRNGFCPSLPEFCMENSGHNRAAVLCLPSTETTALFQKGFVCLSKALRILGFKANPQPGGETLLLSGELVGHSPGPFHKNHPGLSWDSQAN